MRASNSSFCGKACALPGTSVCEEAPKGPEEVVYVDRPACLATALHVRCAFLADPCSWGTVCREHDGRHFPVHQYSSRYNHLELLRAVPDGDGRPYRYRE